MWCPRKVKRYLFYLLLVTLGVKLRSEFLVPRGGPDPSLRQKDLPAPLDCAPFSKSDFNASGPCQGNVSSTKVTEKSQIPEGAITVNISQLVNNLLFRNIRNGADGRKIIETEIRKSLLEENIKHKISMEEVKAALKKTLKKYLESTEAAKNGTKATEIAKKGAPKATETGEKDAKRTIAVSHKVDFIESSLNRTEIERISRDINEINKQQIIYNNDIFRAKGNWTQVIVIQIHNRLNNLRYLVESLSKAFNIRNCLVIFSHDFYDEEMNKFVRNITSFRLIQMFFPYSIQLNPETYPGRDPRDCAWNQVLSKNGSECLNAKWPDSFGHYREPAFTQMKHHWWWKFLRVFKDLRATRDFNGSVIFLEEDHYVAPDIIHVLNLFKELGYQTQFQNFLVYGLGNYQKVLGKPISQVEKGEWMVNKNNMGFALNRDAFEIIFGCRNEFCLYDDYNWDWSLHNVGQTCAKSKLQILALKLSRVFHIGQCGTHFKIGSCDLKQEVADVEKRLSAVQKFLFPERLTVVEAYKWGQKPKASNGGWGDLRDRTLCFAMADGSVESVLSKLITGMDIL